MRAYYYFLISALVASCHSVNKEEQQLLKEAAIIHNVMVKQAQTLKQQLHQHAGSVMTDSIRAWQEALEQWESDLIEVPGNEEHHHEEGEYQHEHTSVYVTPQQMLTIQQELRRRLQAIEKRMN
jgi:hypothetical protein